MITALVQYSPSGDKVIGAWVRPSASDKPQSAYRGTARESKIGQDAVLNQPPDESWLDWCRQLAERTPVNAWYEIREVEDGTTARQVLDAEVRKQFQTAKP